MRRMTFFRMAAAVLSAAVIAGGMGQGRASSGAPYDGTYEGTLGTSAIVAQFTGGVGRYFYASRGLDIALVIKAKGSDLDIAERSAGDDAKAPSTGSWRGSLKGDVINGTWSDPKRKTSLPIALHRIGRPSPDVSGALRDIDAATTPYEWRWAQLRLTYGNGAETKVGDLGYRLVKDSAFGLRYPRLTLFPDQPAMAAANRTLAGIHVSSAVWMRDNMNNAREARAAQDAKGFNNVAEAGMNQQDSITVTTFTRRALSFVETGFWDGGGAHPNQYLSAHTIDLATGRDVPGAVVSASATEPVRFGNVVDLSDPKQRKAFEALWLKKLRAGVAADAAKTPAADGSDDVDVTCAKDITDSEDFLTSGGGAEYALYLKDGGLAVHPIGWPNVAAACFTEYSKVPVVLTAAELKPFLSPGQTLIEAK